MRKIIKLRFSFMPRRCVICNKFLWFRFLYMMPVSYAIAYDYGDCPNEVHCIKCHKEEKREKGFCLYCNWGINEGSRRK